MAKTSLASLFVLAVLTVITPTGAQQPAVFPTLTVTNLAKQKMQLPQDFTGTRNLLLIAFEREQQKDIDTWLPAVKTVESAHPAFRYYEISAIGRANPVFRWYLDSAIRSGKSDTVARERTINVYVDKNEFRRALDIPSDSTVTALLVDKSGKVVWRATGDFTEEKKASLLFELQAAGI